MLQQSGIFSLTEGLEDRVIQDQFYYLTSSARPVYQLWLTYMPTEVAVPLFKDAMEETIPVPETLHHAVTDALRRVNASMAYVVPNRNLRIIVHRRLRGKP